MRGLRRYRTGFERIGMVTFVSVAVAIALLHLLAETGYVPTPDLDQTITQECGLGGTDPMVYLCREAAKAEHRWHHYTAATDTRIYLIVVLIVLSAAILLAGRWSLTWIAEGFRTGVKDD
ncbi:MAG: hypothetical protein CMM48_14260 [Rhodospirillaceae bacterium]|nr:hypothetical protein [Rhodospirillaceae bacterium]MBL25051.1 hypothetical protein [Rhodospirillaceae bacterium]HAA92033.1 hypothetical protein [Rhodospirillaceae bacterium]|tara:strand:+ start:497 stop:856 length:360 start_codon:yes stop_codon:yes gene_type:complete